jgi:very-long-chain ceramide synthase
LQAAKLLKYLGFSTACDVMFGAFVVTWFITRHIFYPLVCWSIYAHTPSAMAPGCYPLAKPMVPMSSTSDFEALGGNDIWGNLVKAYTDRNGPICWNPTIRYSFLGLLLSLQAIILLWFVMIMRIVIMVIRGNGADDVRSDDEGEDSEIEAGEEDPISQQINSVKTSHDPAPIEHEVGVESLAFSCRSAPSVRSYKRSSNRSGSTRTSGISIPGHGDRKELLGRIGCDKPT